ncbi:MAG TPA: hypothetical protein VGC88_06145 [Terriglobales bacterium]
MTRGWRRAESIATLEKAISMVPQAEPGKPKSRQCQAMEEALAEWRRTAHEFTSPQQC